LSKINCGLFVVFYMCLWRAYDRIPIHLLHSSDHDILCRCNYSNVCSIGYCILLLEPSNP